MYYITKNIDNVLHYYNGSAHSSPFADQNWTANHLDAFAYKHKARAMTKRSHWLMSRQFANSFITFID